jgi:hypothetical protein
MFKIIFFRLIICNLIVVFIGFHSNTFCQASVRIQIGIDSTKKWRVTDTIPVSLIIKNESSKSISFINFDSRFQKKSDICLGFFLECLPKGKIVVNQLDKLRLPSKKDYLKLKAKHSKSYNFQIIPLVLNEELIFVNEPKDFVISISYCDRILRRKHAIKSLSSNPVSFQLYHL